VRDAVADVVRRQTEAGVDVITDGEQGKASFFGYIVERFTGFERQAAPPGQMSAFRIEQVPSARPCEGRRRRPAAGVRCHRVPVPGWRIRPLEFGHGGPPHDRPVPCRASGGRAL